MKYHLEFIEYLMKKDGPDTSDYNLFTSWMREVDCEVRRGKLSQDDIQKIRAAFKDALSEKTMQGFSLSKPHGYPGDYEIIEKIYNREVSNNEKLRNWDLYFHAQHAPDAVRNRKQYFVQLLKNLEAVDKREGEIRVLNIASGPARDLHDYMEGDNDGRIVFDCIDHDADSIAFAKKRCAKHKDRLAFFETNALNFNIDKKYRLIWSAGLFDYLNGKKFIFLLNNMMKFLDHDGEVVIGNFSNYNPTREYMEILVDWYLYHRDPENLVFFAEQCGAGRNDIYIGKEPKGVNLFMHIKRGKDFIPPTAPDGYYPT